MAGGEVARADPVMAAGPAVTCVLKRRAQAARNPGLVLSGPPWKMQTPCFTQQQLMKGPGRPQTPTGVGASAASPYTDLGPRMARGSDPKQVP